MKILKPKETDQPPEHPPGDYAIVEVLGHRTDWDRLQAAFDTAKAERGQ